MKSSARASTWGGILAVLVLLTGGIFYLINADVTDSLAHDVTYPKPTCASVRPVIESSALPALIDSLSISLAQKRSEFHKGYIYNKNIFFFMGAASLVIGVVVSILIALDVGQTSKRAKAIIVALPLIGAALTTAMAQFKIKETWDLKIYGVQHVRDLQLRLSLSDCSKKDVMDIVSQFNAVQRVQSSVAGAFLSNTSEPAPPPLGQAHTEAIGGQQ